MKKLLKLLILLTLLAGIAGAVVLAAVLDRMVKTGLETVGSAVTNANVTVETVDVGVLTGRLHFHDVRIANPEGFNSPHAFEVADIEIDFQPRSLLRNTVMIHRVEVRSPQVTYERQGDSSNLSRIKDNVHAFVERHGGGDQASAQTGAADGGRTVVVDELLVSGGMARIHTLPGVPALETTLPDITMRDIGREDQTSVAELIAQVSTQLISSAAQSFTDAGRLLSDSAELLTAEDGILGSGRKAVEAVQQKAGELIDSGVEGLRGLLGDETEEDD